MKVRNYKDDQGVMHGEFQIHRVDTKGKIFDIYDVLNVKETKDGAEVFGKVLVKATHYDPEQKNKTVMLKHYIELSGFLMFCKDITSLVLRTDLSDSSKPYSYQEFKGNDDSKSPTGCISRMFSIKFAEGVYKGAGGFTVEIQNGPGVKNATGAVAPSKEHPQERVSLTLTVPQTRQMLTMAEMYLNCKLTALLAKHGKVLFPAPSAQAE